MKSRLAAKPGLSLQFVELATDIEKLNPRPGSVFIFHISSAAEVREMLTNILSLTKKSPTSMSVVISDVKDQKTKTLVEDLPQTLFYTAERAAHDLDVLILKLIKTQASVLAPKRTDTLTYYQQPETFISKDRTSKTIVTVDTEVAPGESITANPFQPITDGIQKNLLINDAVDSQAAVVISNFGAKDELKGCLFGLDETRNIVFCEIEGTRAAVAAFRKQSDISKKMAISVALKQSRVFFVCDKFKWSKETTVEVSVPSLIYSVQRRRDFRLVCHPDGTQRLVVHEGKLSAVYPIYDLSVGGVSILVPDKDVAHLEASVNLLGVVEINGDEIETGSLKFRQKRAFPGSSGVIRMGFSFEKIKDLAKMKVGSYVDRKGRDYFMDYMMSPEASFKAPKK